MRVDDYVSPSSTQHLRYFYMSYWFDPLTIATTIRDVAVSQLVSMRINNPRYELSCLCVCVCACTRVPI